MVKKKWCRQYGQMCKDPNCKYEHLDEAPESCNSVYATDDYGHFVMCELDKDHKGKHKALSCEWNTEDER